MPEGFAPQLDAWIVDDAPDVGAVLEWAAQRSLGRPYEVFVEAVAPGVIPLFGRSPIQGVDGAVITIEAD